MNGYPQDPAEARIWLDRLWARGRAFLGVDVAILGGAMTWVSERNLVAAISNAGGFGVLACGSMSPELLEAEIEGAKALTDKPFGVNLITMHHQLDELVAVCLRQRVGHVVLAGGLPGGPTIAALKDGGAKVLCFAPALAIARRLLKQGADALIIEGHEAGGHVGPVATSVLAQEILPAIDPSVPVFVAGGIGRGEMMLAYLEMGASGVQLGSLFVCATESTAHAKFKHAFIRGSSRDAVLSAQLDPRFPVIPVRALANAATVAFAEAQRTVIARCDSGELDQKQGQLEIERFWAGALRRAAIDGEVDDGSMMAGQSVGMVKAEQSTAEIIGALIDEAVAGLNRRAARFAAAAGPLHEVAE